MRLRRKTQVDMIDAPLKYGLLFGRMYLDRKIGTPKFTHPTSDTIIRPGRKNLLVSKLQNLFRAKRYADITAFAIILTNNMKEPFFDSAILNALVRYPAVLNLTD